jgi:hypothetical protein
MNLPFRIRISQKRTPIVLYKKKSVCPGEPWNAPLNHRRPEKKVFYRRTVPGDVASPYFATRITFYIAHTLYKHMLGMLKRDCFL